MKDSFKIWLSIATRDIGRLGKERIETEITQHYDEAYRAALDSGHSDDEAKAIAVDSFGDAELAQKRFRKLYLTKIQEVHWGKQIREVFKSHPAWNSCSIIMACFMIPNSHHDWWLLGMGVMFLGQGLEGLWQYWHLKRRMPRKAFLFGPAYTNIVLVLFVPLGGWLFREDVMALSQGKLFLMGSLYLLFLFGTPSRFIGVHKLPRELSPKEFAMLQSTYR